MGAAAESAEWTQCAIDRGEYGSADVVAEEDCVWVRLATFVGVEKQLWGRNGWGPK